MCIADATVERATVERAMTSAPLDVGPDNDYKERPHVELG